MERERLGTTGVGYGVALPHTRLLGLDKIFCACIFIAKVEAQSRRQLRGALLEFGQGEKEQEKNSEEKFINDTVFHDTKTSDVEIPTDLIKYEVDEIYEHLIFLVPKDNVLPSSFINSNLLIFCFPYIKKFLSFERLFQSQLL